MTRQLTDFCALIEMQIRGDYTIADRQLLAVIQARADTRDQPDSGAIRRAEP